MRECKTIGHMAPFGQISNPQRLKYETHLTKIKDEAPRIEKEDEHCEAPQI